MTHPETGRRHARDRYPELGTCETCGAAPAIERHHRDRDTFNNARENVAFLCARCHMLAHGLLAVRPPRPCERCGQPAKPLRRGLCQTCYNRARPHR